MHRRILVLVGFLLAVLVPAGAALAHEERPVTFPDGTGSVPVYRATEPDLLVCKTDRAEFERRIADFPADLKARNLALFEKCQVSGFRHLQEAVDAVDAPGMNIALLPGLYLEEPSLPAPTGACATLDARLSSWGYQILSYEQQVQCPHNQNLVAILGKQDLQVEGTGDTPDDVIVDAQYRKLNAVRADLSDGVYFRNFTAQRTTFNSLYVLATDGFVIDRMLTRWNDEYGFLTFASDHGLYTDCESYGNGDSGLYPGSASNINDGRGREVPRYSIEIRGCKSHHNMVGYSGTAGDSVWAHDNEFFGNLAGMTTDSTFPDHPGLPQNHALFENNRIYDNNADYYKYVRDGTCAKPAAERGYEKGVVCPQIGVPAGTGIMIAGGNWNTVRDNQIWGNEATAFHLLGVPAFIRNEPAWDKQFDTSHDNLFADNTLGVSPAGEQAPNGADLLWDGQGGGNCWDGVGATSPFRVPGCDGTGSPGRALGEPMKLAAAYLCNEYSVPERRVPAGCWWYGASGLAKVEAQAALGGSVVLGLLALLLWRRRGVPLWATAVGLLGLATDVVGAMQPYTVLPVVALALTGAWLVVAGRSLRGAFGGFTLGVGVLFLADAFDKAVWMIPMVPVGLGWIRGALTGVWVLWAVVKVAPRRRRVVQDEPVPEVVPA